MQPTRISLLAGACALAAACNRTPSGAGQGDEVAVVAVSPATDEVARGELKEGIRVTFARPVAPAQAIGRVLAGEVFDVQPPVPGEARWLDVRTLAFLPAGPLRPSTRYRIKLGRGVALAGGARPAAWPGSSFVHDRLAVERVGLAGRHDLQPREPVVTLVASQPLSPDSVGEACGFFARGPDGALGRRTGVTPLPATASADGGTADPAALLAGRAVRLRPEEALDPGQAYVLRCGTGLAPAAGGEGIAKVHEQALSTYGPAAVVAVAPSGRDIAADSVGLRLEFSTPMDPAEIRKRVKLIPRGRAAAALELAADYRRQVYSWSGDLEPGTDYELVVPAGLTDGFGQQLAQGRRHAFRVGDASPRLDAQTGIYAIERGSAEAPRYPVWTRNLARFELACAAVPERKVAAVLTGPANYDAWWGSDARKPIDWKGLGLARRSAVVRPDAARNRWQDRGIDLRASCDGAGGERTGLYLLELATTEERDHRGQARPRDRRSLVNVTDLGLLAKVGNASSLIWVVRLSSGQPVAGAAVAVRDLKGRVRFTGTSNADGVVLAPGATRLTGVRPGNADRGGEGGEGGEEGEGWEDFRGRRVLITARAGDDLAVLDTNWNNGLQSWNFGIDEDRRGGERRVRGFVHSDRGLYRPGDTVHLRGLVRALDGQGRMSVPRQPVHLVIEDPRGTVVEEADLPVSAFGGFARDLALDPEARLGDWHARASVGGWTVSERFSVEEYRPRTFEVKVKPARTQIYLGQKLAFDVEGRWLYGSPMGGGQLTWSVRRRPHLPQFEGWDEYSFRDLARLFDDGRYWSRDSERSFSDTVADGQAVLDGNGKARVETPDVVEGVTGPQDYLVEASVADGTGQAVAGGATVTAHEGDLYLGLHPSETVQAAGMAFAVQVVAFDREGRRRPATAELTFTHRRYDCGPSTDAGEADYGGWRCKRVQAREPALRRTVAVPASGSAAVERVTLSEPGEYVVEVSAGNGRRGRALASDLIYLVGKGEAFWSGDEGERMTVIASKARYRPGETARLVPQTQLPRALALVTLERDGIISHSVRPLASSGEALEIPIERQLAPNVFASVTLVRGRTGAGDGGRPRFKMGMVNLEVDASDRRLLVEVVTDRPAYEPGQTVRARLQVKGQDGAPVRAELAVAAADEGVLQILGYKTPDPLPAFYAPFGLGVESATTWNRLLRPRAPDGADDDGEEGGDAGGAEAGRVRSRFVATAFWNPAVVTGADGSAEVSFPAPDNLTAFRVMAVGADAGDRFGAGEVRFTVAKALQVVPSLPRFLGRGDEAQLTVTLHNNTAAPLTVAVRAVCTGVTPVDGDSRTVELPARASRPAVFAVRAGGAGQASFSFTAVSGKLRDAVVVTLPVEERTTRGTVLVAEGSTTGQIEAKVPAVADALPGRGSLELVVDRTGLSRLDEGFSYLVGYPYGCLEQTTSKVVPMVALGELAGAGGGAGVAGTGGGADRKRIEGYVKAGIAKILRHQHDDGGFGLWIGAPPEVHYTAYALWGLEVARRAGYAVEERARKDGVRYLKAHVRERAPGGGSAVEIAGQTGDHAFAHYVLAELGEPDGAALAALFERRAAMPIYGRAYLLRGLALARRADLAAALTAELVALVPGGAGPVIVREGVRELDWFWSSDTRTTALLLRALMDAAPGSPALARLADGLLGARTDGRWSNTQENVYGLDALAALARSRAAGPPARVVVSVGGRERARFTLAGLTTSRLALPLAGLGAGPFTLAATGAEVFYAARLHVERALGSKAEDVGLAVRREYLDPDTGAPLARIRLGQTVKVRLTVVSPTRIAHVAVVDHLPAGLEPVLTRFRRSYTGEEDGEARPLWWREGWQTAWQNQELRDDRALVFADALAPGESRHEYLVRATTAGRFAAPNAMAEAMYRPEINGRSAAGTLVVER